MEREAPHTGSPLNILGMSMALLTKTLRHQVFLIVRKADGVYILTHGGLHLLTQPHFCVVTLSLRFSHPSGLFLQL